jgi:hypothetical protein
MGGGALKGDIRIFLAPLLLGSFLPGCHDVIRALLPCHLTVLYCATTHPKQQGLVTMDWNPRKCELDHFGNIVKVMES